jgi:hypothetical protein
MKPPEPDQEEAEEAEVEEVALPGFWLLQVLRDMAGGPDVDEDEWVAPSTCKPAP